MAKCEEHSGLDARMNNLEDSDKKQWIAIDKIMNRPPIWATALISLLTFLLGCTLTWAAMK